MNYAAVRLPARVRVQTAEAFAELERKRDERIAELARVGWQPSNGWLSAPREFVALSMMLRRQEQ